MYSYFTHLKHLIFFYVLVKLQKELLNFLRKRCVIYHITLRFFDHNLKYNHFRYIYMFRKKMTDACHAIACLQFSIVINEYTPHFLSYPKRNYLKRLIWRGEKMWFLFGLEWFLIWNRTFFVGPNLLSRKNWSIYWSFYAPLVFLMLVAYMLEKMRSIINFFKLFVKISLRNSNKCSLKYIDVVQAVWDTLNIVKVTVKMF